MQKCLPCLWFNTALIFSTTEFDSVTTEQDNGSAKTSFKRKWKSKARKSPIVPTTSLNSPPLSQDLPNFVMTYDSINNSFELSPSFSNVSVITSSASTAVSSTEVSTQKKNTHSRYHSRLRPKVRPGFNSDFVHDSDSNRHLQSVHDEIDLDQSLTYEKFLIITKVFNWFVVR